MFELSAKFDACATVVGRNRCGPAPCSANLRWKTSLPPVTRLRIGRGSCTPSSAESPCLPPLRGLRDLTGHALVARERRRHRDRRTRLLTFLDAVSEVAALGLKEHDRLTLAQEQMLRRLKGRRGHSKLPRLVGYALSRPLVSSAMIEKELKVTNQRRAQSRRRARLARDYGEGTLSGVGNHWAFSARSGWPLAHLATLMPDVEICLY